MGLKQQKVKKRKLNVGRLLAFAFVLWIMLAFGKNFIQNRKLQQEIVFLEREIAALELRGVELEKEIEQWRLPENVERVAREELGLVKPGEVMYILSEPLSGEVERDVQKR